MSSGLPDPRYMTKSARVLVLTLISIPIALHLFASATYIANPDNYLASKSTGVQRKSQAHAGRIQERPTRPVSSEHSRSTDYDCWTRDRASRRFSRTARSQHGEHRQLELCNHPERGPGRAKSTGGRGEMRGARGLGTPHHP
jgi:hypothetical protein